MPTEPNSRDEQQHMLDTEEPQLASAAVFQPVAPAAKAPAAASGRDSGTGSQRPEGSDRGSPSLTLFASEHEHTAGPGDLSMLDITINQRPDGEHIRHVYEERTAQEIDIFRTAIEAACKKTYTEDAAAELMPDKAIVNEKIRATILEDLMISIPFQKRFFGGKTFSLTEDTAPVFLEGLIAIAVMALSKHIFDPARLDRFLPRDVVNQVIPQIESEVLERNKQSALNESVIETSRLSKDSVLREILALLRYCTKLTLNDEGSFTIRGEVSTAQRPRNAGEETTGYYISAEQLARFMEQEASKSQAGSQAGSEASFRKQ